MKQLRLVALAVGVVLGVLAPQTASGAQPLRLPSQAFVGTFPAGQVCPFAVYTEPVGPTQTLTFFFDGSGNVVRIAFTGSAFDLLRNVGTGKTIIENSSGQGTLIPQADGSLLGAGGGPGLFALFPGDSRGPALLAIDGRDTFTITAPDSSGATHITNLAIVGKVTDLCAVLAS